MSPSLRGIMGQTLHRSAKTTHAVRALIQRQTLKTRHAPDFGDHRQNRYQVAR